MNEKDILLYIYGYLNSLYSLSKISTERVLVVKEVISNFNNSEQDIDNYNSDYQDYDNNRDDNSDSIYDHPNYNPDLDIDQQGPDFDFW